MARKQHFSCLVQEYHFEKRGNTYIPENDNTVDEEGTVEGAPPSTFGELRENSGSNMCSLEAHPSLHFSLSAVELFDQTGKLLHNRAHKK